MELEVWQWAAFGGLVLALLLVDLFLFGRGTEEISFRRAVYWSIWWTALGVAFGAFLWWWQGSEFGQEYLAGFLIEKSLSVDNLFVFALILSYFSVPVAYQRRVIFWGIVGAIILRAIFIAGGAVLLDLFHWTIYVFGAFLIVTGIRMARHSDMEIHPENNPALKLLKRAIPLTTEFHGDRMTIKQAGKRVATPMVAAFVLVATFDVVFAVDSIPAIFAVTRETFIVYAANAFSLLGLAALYFVLVGMMGKFRYLNVGLAVILIFVGLKMMLADVYHLNELVSLGVIVGVLGVAVGASLLKPEPPVAVEDAEEKTAEEAVERVAGEEARHV
ncbi:MAG TPA: TerC family protein [Gaiellaceae bacterium]|nr:TerC family protein [Gaiellaceae bacterium]